MKRSEKLAQKLQDYDLSGVSFHDAKQALLKEGYGENEISIAVADRPFDGKINAPKAPNPITKTLEKDPELAQEYADTLLNIEAEHRQLKTRAHAAASQVRFGSSGINPYALKGSSYLADDLGIPLFSIVGFGAFISAIIYGLSTFGLFEPGVTVVFIIWYSTAISVLYIAYFTWSELFTSRGRSKVTKKSNFLHTVVAYVLAILAIIYVILQAITVLLELN